MGCFSFKKKHDAIPEEPESQARVSNLVFECTHCNDCSLTLSRLLVEAREPTDQLL